MRCYVCDKELYICLDREGLQCALCERRISLNTDIIGEAYISKMKLLPPIKDITERDISLSPSGFSEGWHFLKIYNPFKRYVNICIQVIFFCKILHFMIAGFEFFSYTNKLTGYFCITLIFPSCWKNAIRWHGHLEYWWLDSPGDINIDFLACSNQVKWETIDKFPKSRLQKLRYATSESE